MAVCSVIGGVLWLTWEAVRLLSDDTISSNCSSPTEYAADATFALAGLFVGAALLSMAAVLSGPLRWLAIVAAAGSAVTGVANGIEHCVFEPFWLLNVVGATAVFLSTAALGVLLFVTRSVFGWRSLLLVAGAAGMMLSFERGAAAVYGAAWLAFGISLIFEPGTPSAH
jgi:hypothetical protein